MSAALSQPASAHERALDLAGASPAFRLTADEERELRAHLGACPSCSLRAARLRADAAALGSLDAALSPRLHDRLREVAVSAPRSGPSPLGIVLALVLVGAAVVGGSIGAGALLGTRRPDDARPPAQLRANADDTVAWQTDAVRLFARSVTITANGLTFSGAGAARVSGDVSAATGPTLEATWREHDREQRLFLYFRADKGGWWLDRVAAYDGDAARPEWASVEVGRQAATPVAGALGGTFSGDLSWPGVPSATGPVGIHLDGVRLAVSPVDLVNEPPLGGTRTLRENGDPAVDGDPFGRGGPLRCSGILQLPPKAAQARLLALGYALSWRWEYSTGTRTGYAEARREAPDGGYISSTAVGSSGELIVFVEDPTRPTTGAAALPAECPGSPSP